MFKRLLERARSAYRASRFDRKFYEKGETAYKQKRKNKKRLDRRRKTKIDRKDIEKERGKAKEKHARALQNKNC